MLFYLIPILRARMFVILSWGRSNYLAQIQFRDYDHPTKGTPPFCELGAVTFWQHVCVAAILQFFVLEMGEMRGEDF